MNWQIERARAQQGIRCRADDQATKKSIAEHVVRIARRYGGQMLGDIDISTGEMVYRAEIDERAYAQAAASIRRRRARR